MDRTTTLEHAGRASRSSAGRAALVALALAACAAPAGAAHFDYDANGWERTAHGGVVDVQVLVEGRSAPLYLAPGRWDRRYIQAFRGRHYALLVRNRTDRRIGVLISVDGLNVVNGERSRLDHGESMYVLDPWESATVRGWRTSLEQVRQFVFVDEERSYAERTDQANGDMGWIRVLAFEEQTPFSWLDRPGLRALDRDQRSGGERNELGDGKAGRPAPQASPESDRGGLGSREPSAVPPAEKSRLEGAAPRADAYPGTGWGERRQDPVRETWFVARATPTDRLVFRYEYANGLRALGIDLGGDRLRERERGELGFAKPPKW